MPSPIPIDTASTLARPAQYTSKHVQAGGLRLHYLDYGTAGRPPMLCVHGGAAHAHWFDFVASGLNDAYHVMAIDQRGHGDSERAPDANYSYGRYAADLGEAIDNLGLTNLVLIGHSMGGMVSLQYAAQRPQRLGKLIIVDSTLRMTEDRIARLRDIGERPGSSYASREEFITRYRLRPTGTTAAPHVIRHLAENGSRLDDDGLWRHKFDRDVYARRESIDGLPAWGKVDVPALLIKGGLSERITPAIRAEIEAQCPHLEFAEVAGSDHHVTLDNPAGFVEAVRAFLTKHP